MKSIEYGDIVTVTSTNGFWQAGSRMFVIAPEGDGELGLREHSICFKLGQDGKPAKNLGAYEVPWKDIDFNSIEDAAKVALKSKVETLEKTIEAKQKEHKKAVELYVKAQRDKDVFINDFAQELG